MTNVLRQFTSSLMFYALLLTISTQALAVEKSAKLEGVQQTLTLAIKIYGASGNYKGDTLETHLYERGESIRFQVVYQNLTSQNIKDPKISYLIPKGMAGVKRSNQSQGLTHLAMLAFYRSHKGRKINWVFSGVIPPGGNGTLSYDLIRESQ